MTTPQTSACMQFGRRLKELSDNLADRDIDAAFRQMVATQDFLALDVLTPTFNDRNTLLKDYKDEVAKVIEAWGKQVGIASQIKTTEIQIDDNGKVTLKGNLILQAAYNANIMKYFPQMVSKIDGDMTAVGGLSMNLDRLEEITGTLHLGLCPSITSLARLKHAGNMNISGSGVTRLESLETINGYLTPSNEFTAAPKLRRAGYLSLKNRLIQSFESLEEVTDGLDLNSKLKSAPRLKNIGRIFYYEDEDLSDFDRRFPALDHIGADKNTHESFSLLKKHVKLRATLEQLQQEGKLQIDGHVNAVAEPLW